MQIERVGETGRPRQAERGAETDRPRPRPRPRKLQPALPDISVPHLFILIDRSIFVSTRTTTTTASRRQR